MNYCTCGGSSYTKGHVPDLYVAEGTTIHTTIYHWEECLGEFQVKPGCPMDHPLCAFITKAIFATKHFDTKLEFERILSAAITITKLCLEHNCMTLRVEIDLPPQKT